jgi:hypothetical protein
MYYTRALTANKSLKKNLPIRASSRGLIKKKTEHFIKKNRNCAKTTGNRHIKVALKINSTFTSSVRNGSCHLKK